MFEAALKFIRTEFWGDKRRFQNSFKIALACVLAVIFNQYVQLGQSFLSVLTIMIVSSISVGSSLKQSLNMAIGTVIGGILAAWLVARFGQQMFLYIPLYFSVLVAAAYFGHGRWHPEIFSMAIITVVIIGVATMESQQDAIYTGLTRITQILVGIVSYQVINMTIWPANAKDELNDSIAKTLRDAGRHLVSNAGLLAGGDITLKSNAVSYSLAQSYSRNLSLLSQAGYESSRLSGQSERIMELVLTTERIVHILRNMENAVIEFSGKNLTKVLAGSLTSFCGEMEAVLAGIAGHAGNAEFNCSEESSLSGKAARLKKDFMEAGSTGELEGWRERDLEKLYELIHDIETIAQLVDRISLISGPRWRSPYENGVKVVSENRRGSFFSLNKLKPDYELLKYAVLIALCVILFIPAEVYLHLAFAGTAAVTVAIIFQPDIGARKRMALLLNIGCIAGGMIALFCVYFLIPHMTLLWQQLIMIFTLFFIFGYIKWGSERISYAGVQMGFAFAYAGMTGLAPNVHVLPVFNRLLGIFLGLLVGGYLFDRIWPRYACQKIAGSLIDGLKRHARYQQSLRNIIKDPASFDGITGSIMEDNVAQCKKMQSLFGEALMEKSGEKWNADFVHKLMVNDEELVYRMFAYGRDVADLAGQRLNDELLSRLELIGKLLTERLEAFGRRYEDPIEWDNGRAKEVIDSLRQETGSVAVEGEASGILNQRLLETAARVEAFFTKIDEMTKDVDALRDAEQGVGQAF